MTNYAERGAPQQQQPKRLGTTYSVILGALGALTSILALVQLLTTKNTLIITLLLTAVLGLAVIAVNHTWHSHDPRLKWLGSLTIVALVLASLGGGYGLGRTAAPVTKPTMVTPGQTITRQNTAPPINAGSTTAAPATMPSDDIQPLWLARVGPPIIDMGLGGSWTAGSALIEGIEYDEAIIAFVSACYSVNVGRVEFVLGRKYKRLTGKVALTDDTTNTTPMPFVIVLDEKAQGRKNVTTTPLEINVDLNGVNRIRFELTQTNVLSYCRGAGKVAFVGLVAQP